MSIRNVSQYLIKTIVQQQNPVLGSVRLYSRWKHRNPAKVLLPFEPTTKVNLKKEKVIDLDPGVLTKSEEIPVHEPDKIIDASDHKFPPKKSRDIRSQKEEKLKKRMFYLSQQKVFDDNNEIIYEKLNENDGRISTLLTNLKSKKDRLRTQQIMVEGWRLLVDGLEAKCHLKYVVFSRMEDLNNLRPFLPKTGIKFYKIPYREIEMWSDVETSPGIFGIFEMPTQENVRRFARPLPLQFICDNIRVPGNLGAILRAAVGAGCDRVLLTKGCVDVWEPKVVRSAAGAHFRLPIHYSLDWEDMTKYLEDTSIFIADSNAKVLDNEDPETRFEGLQIPVLPYFSVDYATLNHITLVIGGETEGISEESYRLAISKNGLRLHIPLQKGIDSLNTGMATAVIAFEIRKQLIQAWTKLKEDRQRAEAT